MRSPPEVKLTPAAPARPPDGAEPVLTELRVGKLAALLRASPSAVLLVDVRAWHLFADAHVLSALSICIPSTLIKRATFGFERMLQFVAPQDVVRLRALQTAANIVFYDHSTAHCSTDSALFRTAQKFLTANPPPVGKLCYLYGGFQAVLQHAPELVVYGDDGGAQRRAPRLTLAGGFERRPPPIDESTQINTDEIEAKVELPDWLAQAIEQTRQGNNVLAHSFAKLEAAERQRMHRVSWAAAQTPRTPVAPMLKTPTTPSGPHTPRTPRSPFSPQKFQLITGDDVRKNRYTNIAPYAHNAVQIRNGEYFNGSYICSTHSSLRYIATQAPPPAAFGDFWRCVWEQQVPLIVMLTTLVSESGQRKADQYFKSGLYDGIEVRLVSEEAVCDGTLKREFELNFNDETHTVYQLHYLRWPDLGCPANPQEALNLVELKRSLMREKHIPKDSFVIVHCSAGCGRTGTFCTIDTVIDNLSDPESKQTNTDLIFSTVTQFREQRLAMVQNQPQLLLCYQAVMLWCSRRHR